MARPVAFFESLVFAILSTSCAEPPQKDMNQAQGATDAARSAGADWFAAGEVTAATDALKRSQEAAAGHYRQALDHALDSRERAHSAEGRGVCGRHGRPAWGRRRGSVRGDARRSRFSRSGPELMRSDNNQRPEVEETQWPSKTTSAQPVR